MCITPQPIERFPSPCTDLACSHLCLLTGWVGKLRRILHLRSHPARIFPSPVTASCACPDTFVSNLTKNGKITCSCPKGTVSTVKNLKNVCEPATFSAFTAVPDLASELAMSDDEIARALLNKEPVVRPVDNHDAGSSAAVVLLLFILVLIIVCCVFIKCKKTKSGPEVRNFYAF